MFLLYTCTSDVTCTTLNIHRLHFFKCLSQAGIASNAHNWSSLSPSLHYIQAQIPKLKPFAASQISKLKIPKLWRGRPKFVFDEIFSPTRASLRQELVNFLYITWNNENKDLSRRWRKITVNQRFNERVLMEEKLEDQKNKQAKMFTRQCYRDKCR